MAREWHGGQAEGRFLPLPVTADPAEYSAEGGEVYTDAHHDWASFYTADGQFLFEGQFRMIEHYTVTPDGTLRVDFERIVSTPSPARTPISSVS